MRAAIMLLVLLVTARVVDAAPPAEELPRGAIARLGQLHFQHEWGVVAVALSPDNETLATAARDQRVHFWNRNSGVERQGFDVRAEVRTLRYSADGKLLAYVDIAGRVQTYDVEKGAFAATLANSAQELRFLPDGKSILVAIEQGIGIFNARTGALVRRMPSPNKVWSVAASSDGELLASGDDQGQIRLFDANTGKLGRRLSMDGGLVQDIVISPDGKTLTWTSSEATIFQVNVKTGALIWKQELNRDAWMAGVLVQSSDGNTLTTLGREELTLLESGNGKVRYKVPRSAFAAAFSLDDRVLVLGGIEGNLWFLDVASGTPTARRGHSGKVTALGFSSDGGALLSAGIDRTLRLWALDTRSERQKFPLNFGAFAVAPLSPGQGFAVAADDGLIHLVGMDGHENQRLPATLAQTGCNFAVSADRKTMAWGSPQAAVSVMDVASRKLKKLAIKTDRPTDSDGPVSALTFSPDGKQLAVISNRYDSAIQILDAASGSPAGTLERTGRVTEKDGITCLAFSPDGKWFVASSTDGSLRIWNFASGKEAAYLAEHDAAINSMVFLADGRTLATASDDRNIRLWDIILQRGLRVLRGHKGPVLSLASLPAKKWLASASTDGTVLLWDLGAPVVAATDRFGDALPDEATARLGTIRFRQAKGFHQLLIAADSKTFYADELSSLSAWDSASGKITSRYEQHEGSIDAFTVSPDSQVLALVSQGQTVKLLQARTLEPLRTLAGGGRKLRGLAFAPDGQTLAAASEDGNVVLWNPLTGAQLKAWSLGQPAASLAWSPDGRTLALGSAREVLLLNAQTGAIKERRDAHGRSVTFLNFSPDGKSLVAMAEADAWQICLWDTGTAKLRAQFESSSNLQPAAAFSPDSQALVWTSGATLHEYSLPTGKETSSHALSLKTGSSINSLLFLPESRSLVVGCDGSMLVIERASGKLVGDALEHHTPITAIRTSPDSKTVATISAEDKAIFWAVSDSRPLFALADVRGLSFSPDGKTMASVSSQGTVAIHDAASGQRIRALARRGATDVLYLDRTELALAAEDGVYVHDVKTGKELRKLDPEGKVDELACSADGRTLVVLKRGEFTKVFDAAGKKLREFEGDITSVAISPDGRQLAVGTGGFRRSAFLLVDVSSGNRLSAAEHMLDVEALTFSPDGRTVATVSVGLLRRFDVFARKPLPVLRVPDSPASAVAYSPDGRWLASGSFDSTVLLWPAR